jgi:CheY-like chemotaxis protein
MRKSTYVLIVDDDRAIREALEDILVDDGYTVRVASDGREGLEVCTSRPVPDLILLDLSMPVMDGYEFYRRKQDSPALAAIPVCVMTAAAPWSPLPTNVSAVLRKPLDAADLMAIIKRLCPWSGQVERRRRAPARTKASDDRKEE